MAGVGGGPDDHEHISDLPRSIGYYDYAYEVRMIYDATVPTLRACPCRHSHSYPNLVVHQVVKERDELLRDSTSQKEAAREHIQYLDGRVNYAYGRIASLREELKQTRHEKEAIERQLVEMEQQVQLVTGLAEPQVSELSVNQPMVWEADPWFGLGQAGPGVYSDAEEGPEEEPEEDPEEDPIESSGRASSG